MTIRTVCLLLILPCLLQPGASWGHGEVPPRIRNATREIQKDPSNAKLYRHRGSLYRRYQKWDDALSDYQQVARLQPDLPGTILPRAEILTQLKRYEEAENVLAPYLQAHPDNLQALRLHARLLSVRGRFNEMDAVYTRILADLRHPTADFYIEWIDTLMDTGPEQFPRALKHLDTALARLGPVPSLQLKALRIEEARANYDAALGWLDKLLASSTHPETWLVRKGQLLKQAGRSDDATTAYREALDAWEQRPAWAQETHQAKELYLSIKQELP